MKGADASSGLPWSANKQVTGVNLVYRSGTSAWVDADVAFLVTVCFL